MYYSISEAMISGEFMIISNSGVDASNAMWQINDNIVLKPALQVNVLGVTLNISINMF